MTDAYRLDNTTGYTQAELDALNDELQGILAAEACSSDDTLIPDDVERITKQHADAVARR